MMLDVWIWSSAFGLGGGFGISHFDFSRNNIARLGFIARHSTSPTMDGPSSGPSTSRNEVNSGPDIDTELPRAVTDGSLTSELSDIETPRASPLKRAASPRSPHRDQDREPHKGKAEPVAKRPKVPDGKICCHQ